METKSYPASGFSGGFITGVLGALFLGIVLLYILNMSEVLAISVLDVPSVQRVLAWAYENLRLSVVPFFLTLVFYAGALWRLKHYLKDHRATVEKIAQADHLVDIWINLFFGIGVIWTAIGIGLIADASIIYVENTYRHLQGGMERLEALVRSVAISVTRLPDSDLSRRMGFVLTNGTGTSGNHLVSGQGATKLVTIASRASRAADLAPDLAHGHAFALCSCLMVQQSLAG